MEGRHFWKTELRWLLSDGMAIFIQISVWRLFGQPEDIIDDAMVRHRRWKTL